MEFQEFEGKSTEAAIELACAHFQAPPEKLEIEIISVGSPGLFGLGSRKARIKAALREEGESEENLLPLAQELLEQLLEKMQEAAKVTAHQDGDRITLSIETGDAGLLIGKQGQTLDALQYLLTKMLAKQSRRRVRVAIDVEAYRERHSDSLAHMARKYGEKVKRSGKAITLSPMNPYDRRIVHLALQGDKELKTLSRGEGLFKKVIISPVKKKEGQEDAPGPKESS
jgi:spoIIIJ-associated protein